MGRQTLLADMDPQSHCAVGLAVPEDQIDRSIYDVMISQTRDTRISLDEILWEISDKLDLAPASIDLSAFAQQMSGVSDRDRSLAKVLDRVKDRYDFVVVDCPPAVGLLTFNALQAATDVIVPVETGYFALHGLSKQLETLNLLCKRCRKKLNVRVLASMYDIRTKMARQVLAELKNHFGDKMFKTIINFNTRLKEAASLGQPIFEYDPASKGRNDFHNLAKELLQTGAKTEQREMVESLSERLAAMSSTADELLAESKQPPKSENVRRDISQGQSTLRGKLSDYYGVTQMDGETVFVTLYPRAESVFIAGDFNNWQPEKTPMEKVGDSGVWQTKLELPRGKHRYRLVVDGKWQQDPYNGKTEPNAFGDLNSVVEVK
jgi:chromosome partitioning protein